MTDRDLSRDGASAAPQVDERELERRRRLVARASGQASVSPGKGRVAVVADRLSVDPAQCAADMLDVLSAPWVQREKALRAGHTAAAELVREDNAAEGECSAVTSATPCAADMLDELDAPWVQREKALSREREKREAVSGQRLQPAIGAGTASGGLTSEPVAVEDHQDEIARIERKKGERSEQPQVLPTAVGHADESLAADLATRAARSTGLRKHPAGRGHRRIAQFAGTSDPTEASDSLTKLPSRRLRRIERRVSADRMAEERAEQQLRVEDLTKRHGPKLEKQRREFLKQHGDKEAPEPADPANSRLRCVRQLWIDVQLLLRDRSGLRARLTLSRMRSRELAGGALRAAVVPLSDGTCRYNFVGSRPDALRARRIVALALIFDSILHPIFNRPGVVGMVRGVGVCFLLRMIGDVDSDSEPLCRECGHRHPSRSAFNHRGADDSLETGDVGYAVALELTGALQRFQHRNPYKIQAKCKPWEIGTSSYPCNWYFVAGHTFHPQLRAVDILWFAAMRDEADSVWDAFFVRLTVRERRAAARIAAADGGEHVVAPP